MNQEINMTVSSVCEKNGRQYAYVSFSDGKRVAEGIIPECRIQTNQGFEDHEVMQLENYMKRELKALKRMAASIRLIDALY